MSDRNQNLPPAMAEIYRQDAEITRLQSENEALEARVAELEDAASWCEAENGDMQSIMALVRVVERGSSHPWLLRKQAEAVDACKSLFARWNGSIITAGHGCAILEQEAQRLRQQADELEAGKAGGEQ